MTEAESKFWRLMYGGKASEMRILPQDVDPDQLEAGIEIEHEHTPDRDVATKIALDHLAEYQNYYSALIEMERRLEAEKGKMLVRPKKKRKRKRRR